MIVDRQGRRFRNLRISLTAACNYACTYCVPDGKRLVAAQDELSAEAMVRGVAYLIEAAGIERLRITGGEPLVSPKLEHFLRGVSRLGLQDIGLTSNGQLLSRKLPLLLECGLKRINVSLDTLDPVAFKRIARGGDLPTVLQGLAEARAAGLKIKINMVPLRGQNHEQVLPMLDYCLENGFELRFIELMQTGEMDTLFRDHHASGALIKQRLLDAGWLQQLRGADDGPAQVFMHPESMGGVGLIMPYSKDFCAGCNRLRVSSLGKLHLCLFGDHGVELRDLLTADGQQDELQQRIRSALVGKAATHRLHEGNAGMTPHLASIGG